MKDLTDRALDAAAAAGATYADVRVEQLGRQVIVVKNGRPEGVSEDESIGFGVRAIAGDAWGFASSSRLEPGEIDRVARLAVQVARSSALAGGDPVQMGEPVTSIGSFATPVA